MFQYTYEMKNKKCAILIDKKILELFPLGMITNLINCPVCIVQLTHFDG